MRLYHYSNIKTDKLKIDNFGDNSFTRNDKTISDIKRLFFYTEKKPEGLLQGCKYLYIVNIYDNCIYNLYNDDEDFVLLNSKYYGITDFHSLLGHIKKNYKGVLYNIPSKLKEGINIVNLFIDIIPDNVIEL